MQIKKRVDQGTEAAAAIEDVKSRYVEHAVMQLFRVSPLVRALASFFSVSLLTQALSPCCIQTKDDQEQWHQKLAIWAVDVLTAAHEQLVGERFAARVLQATDLKPIVMGLDRQTCDGLPLESCRDDGDTSSMGFSDTGD